MSIAYEIESFTPAPAGWFLVYRRPLDDEGTFTTTEVAMPGWLTITTANSEDTRFVVAANVIEGYLVPAHPAYDEVVWELVDVVFRPSKVFPR